MAKELTKEEIEKIRVGLTSKKSAERRSAAGKIGRYNLCELGDALFEAYQKEVLDKRTWETQWYMVNAFGKIEYRPALPVIEEIIKTNKETDTITGGAAISYIRITRKNVNDATPVLELLKKGNFSVMRGATDVLSFDKMKPAPEQIKAIIEEVNKKEEDKLYIRGCGDVRYGILSASAFWDRKNPVVKAFIEKCLAIPRIKEESFAEKIIEGKKFVYE